MPALRTAPAGALRAKVVGVPSLGMIVGGDFETAKRTKQMPVRVVYANEADAARALAALAALPTQPGAPEGIARVIELLHAHQDGREIVVDVFGMMTDDAALATLRAIVHPD